MQDGFVAARRDRPSPCTVAVQYQVAASETGCEVTKIIRSRSRQSARSSIACMTVPLLAVGPQPTDDIRVLRRVGKRLGVVENSVDLWKFLRRQTPVLKRPQPGVGAKAAIAPGDDP